MTQAFKLNATQTASLFGMAVAIAGAIHLLIAPTPGPSPSALLANAYRPLEPSDMAAGSRVLLPWLVYLLPMAPASGVWLVNMTALWAGAITLAVWSNWEKAGIGGSLMVCLAFMISPQVRDHFADMWTTFYLVYFWGIVAGFAGRWKYDVLGSIALVGMVLTHPTLWFAVLAIWAVYRFQDHELNERLRLGLVIFPAVLTWVILILVWWPSTYLVGTLWPSLEKIPVDRTGIQAIQEGFDLAKIWTFIRMSENVAAPLTLLLPLAICGMGVHSVFRRPVLGISVIVLAMYLSPNPIDVALLAAPLILPAAAVGLGTICFQRWWLEVLAGMGVLVLYGLKPYSLLGIVGLAVLTAIGIGLQRFVIQPLPVRESTRD